MTLIRSRTLFDYEDNESVSAPLRTFFRNSDDHQFSSRSPSYNLERRTSRRSAYSFRGQPSFHDVIRNEVGMLSNPITITVESRDASNQSGRKLPSSKNGMFNIMRLHLSTCLCSSKVRLIHLQLL